MRTNPTPNHLRAYRTDRLMTQLFLAKKAGVSLRTVHSVEAGLPCRVETKRRILRALGVTFADRHKVFPS